MATILRNYKPEKKKLFITWQAIDHDLRRFVRELEDEGRKFSGIYAPARGGWVLAACLSNYLEIPILSHVFDETVLVVDDIIDSGSTLAPYFGKNYIFTPYFNPRRSKIVKPTKYYHRKSGGFWIVFPWEKEAL